LVSSARYGGQYSVLLTGVAAGERFSLYVAVA
jgi:hypothetical protein